MKHAIPKLVKDSKHKGLPRSLSWARHLLPNLTT